MSAQKSVLVCGIDEAASAVARRLFGEGYGVTLYRATAPRVLRRRMSFADAWFDGYAQLDGVEARRADVSSEFLLGLRTREFIPLLRCRFSDVFERWPWDVIVAAKEDGEPGPSSLRSLAELTIGLGRGFAAGVDCDLAIETEGADPGAILRAGERGRPARAQARDGASGYARLTAPSQGLFHPRAPIGAVIEEGEILGLLEDAPVLAAVGGRISGMARNGEAVKEGAPIAEIALSRGARVAGVRERNKLVSRGVAFAVEMDAAGHAPFSLESWL